ncbi:MAG TPA: glycosyltransferase family 9 protein [Opitutus sp.]|nr:glycosyltransferase family 9 protein [Opitutus sp.]
MTSTDSRPPRLLVIRYRFIGDTVLAIPFLRNLRRAFPESAIDVLAEPVSGDTLAHCPYINEILFYAPRATAKKRGRGAPAAPFTRSNPVNSLLACARLLRARRYDRVYILRRSFSSAVLTLLARIPHRVGFSTEGRALLLQRSTPYDESKHEVECFLDILRADNVPVLGTHNENWSDPATDARVDAALPPSNRRRVLVCAKSVFPPKDWSPDRFGVVLAWLIAERNCEIHFCDTPANAAYYAAISSHLPSPLHAHLRDWSRELTIRDVNSLIRRIDLAFGIDTGLLHIAASFHVPVVALFGPLDPNHWHPWDTAHTILRPADVSGPHPLLRLTIAEVQAALDRHLADLPASPC